MVPIGFVLLGTWSVLRPADIVWQERELGDLTTPTSGELWRTRVVGVVLFVAGLYILWLMLSGAKGAEDPVMF
jgi:hypothetical protein